MAGRRGELPTRAPMIFFLIAASGSRCLVMSWTGDTYHHTDASWRLAQPRWAGAAELRTTASADMAGMDIGGHAGYG